MTHNRTLALSAALALAFAITTPANAQFGNLLNKAKKTVKENVNMEVKAPRKKAEDAAAGAVSKITGEADRSTEPSIAGAPAEESGNYGGAYNGIETLYKRNLRPSEAAMAADPKASITTVEKNYTKSPAQMRGVWEKLDAKLFPYRPYYDEANKGLYTPDDDAPVMVYGQICRLLAEAEMPFGKPGLFAEFVKYKDDLHVPTVDMLLCSYYAEFIADPESYVAYNHFVKARIAHIGFTSDRIKMNMKDPMKFTATMGDGATINLFEKEFDRIGRWRNVNRMAERLAFNVTPFDIIGAAATNAINRYKQHEAKGDTKQMIVTSREIQAIMDDLVHHDQYEQRKGDCSLLVRQYEPIKDKYRALLQESSDASAPAVGMPKGVSVPAAIKSKADAEARKQWGDAFVKSVFLTSQWKQFKNPRYPYQVMHRSMDVDFIVKEGGNYFVYHWVLKEGVSNGKGTGTFSIMARMKRPTKEKVDYR